MRKILLDTTEFESNLSAVQGIREDAAKVEWELQEHDVMQIEMIELEAIIKDIDFEYLDPDDVTSAVWMAIEENRDTKSDKITVEI